MAKLVSWKIWYDDGSVFSSQDGSWEDAPVDGVQVLVEYYDDGSKTLHVERDYYILDEGKAYGTNNINPFLRKYGIIKFGRWSSNDNYKKLVQKAKEENVLNSGKSQ